MIYMFASGRGRAVYGFTDNPTGSNLPLEFTPWHPLGIQALSGAGGLNSADIIDAAIHTQGYYVTKRSSKQQSDIIGKRDLRRRSFRDPTSAELFDRARGFVGQAKTAIAPTRIMLETLAAGYMALGARRLIEEACGADAEGEE